MKRGFHHKKWDERLIFIMTKEEAIKHLESYIGNECYTDFHQNACRMAVAALRTQQTHIKLDRSRWEGCPVCINKGCVICRSGQCRKDEFPCCDCSANDMFELDDGFCPSCGRPLTDAAWVELERRINGGTTD